MNLGIKGKYALVTGGSHGIGYSTAMALAEEGCNVAICARNQERIKNVVRELDEMGVTAIGLSADVQVAADIERTINAMISLWGTIHILINNVGGGDRWGSPIVEETPEEVLLDVYNKNVLADVRFTRLAIPYMRKQKWGRVVTIASVYGHEDGGRPWVNMAKSAEISPMKTFALDSDLARDGITFNSVAHGGIMIPETGWETEMKNDPEEFQRMVNLNFPRGRMGTPEEVASLVLFLCSERASLINGACIPADGGESRSF